MELLEDKKSLGREDCNVPIFKFPCSTIGNDFMSLCQLDQRGNLMLPMRSKGLEELYDTQPYSFIIFHHQYHSCAVNIVVPMHFDCSHNLGVILSII
jgi:hypothetical protein